MYVKRFLKLGIKLNPTISNVISTKPPTIVVQHIDIIGTSTVNENETSQYTCIATYSNSSTTDITNDCTWSVSDNMTISNSGLLSTDMVDVNTPITVSVSYIDEFDITFNTSLPVVVGNIPLQFDDLSVYSYSDSIDVVADGHGMSYGADAIYFSPDGGTMMYPYKTASDVMPRIVSYQLSTPWDHTSKGSPSYSNLLFDIEGGMNLIYITFNPTGDLLIALSNYQIMSYSLSTPYDITTLTHVLTRDHSGGAVTAGYIDGAVISSDGMKLFLGTSNILLVSDFDVSWDISNLTLDETIIDGHHGYNITELPTTQGLYCIYFNDDGTRFYSIDPSTNWMYSFSMETPYDLANIVYAGDDKRLLITPSADGDYFLTISTDMNHMYMGWNSEISHYTK